MHRLLVLPVLCASLLVVWVCRSDDTGTRQGEARLAADEDDVRRGPPRLASRRRDTLAAVTGSEPLVSVAGHLVDRYGRPVAGAQVTYEPPDDATVQVITSDASGAFRLSTDTPLGNLEIHAPTGSCGIDLGGEDWRDVRVRLTETAPLEGVVRSHRGAPVADARVRAGDWSEARTDASGFFRLPAVPTQEEFSVRIEGGRHGWAVRKKLVWAEGERLRVALPPTHTASGRVVRETEDGTLVGLAGANVRNTYWERGHFWWQDGECTRTAADGSFQLAGLVHHGRLTARSEAWSSDDAPDVPTGNGVVIRVRRRRAPERITITGAVEGPERRPVAHARVRLPQWPSDAETRCDAQGRFALENIVLPRRTRTLYARLDDLEGSVEVAAEPGRSRKDVLVIATRTPSLSGVVLQTDGTPLAFARVRASWMAHLRTCRREARTDHEGRFRVFDLPYASTLDVSVEAPGFVPGRRSGVQAEVGGREMAPFTLTRAVRRTGRVVDPWGRPVPTASVAVEPGLPVRRQPVRADGTFHVDLAPDRRFEEFRTEAPGYCPREMEPEDVAAAGPIVVVLEPARRVQGRLLDTHGRPVRSAKVHLSGPGATVGRSRSRTDLAGRFEFFVEAAGTYRVAVEECGLRFPRGAAAVAGAEEAVIQAVVPRRLAGRVEDPHGRPLVGVRVGLESRALGVRFHEHRQTDAMGRFSFDDLTERAYRITAWDLPDDLVLRPRSDVDVGQEHLRLHAEHGVTISGCAVWADGTPAADVEVHAEPCGHDAEDEYESTRANGTFVTEDLPEGDFRIDAWIEVELDDEDETTIRYEGHGGVVPAGSTGVRVVLYEVPPDERDED